MSDLIQKTSKAISDDAEKIIDFVHYAEKLKTELRHASKSDCQRESVAEHTWRVTLFLLLVAPKLTVKIDHLRALKIAIIHDIVEIEAKDVPTLERIDNEGFNQEIAIKEKKAIEKIHRMLGSVGDEIVELWNEFEDQKTNEAKVVKALDKLEGQIQFITENVTEFDKEDKEKIHKALEEVTKLSKVDPFLARVEELTMPDRLKRTGLSNG